MTATRLLARPLLSSMFVVGAVNALKNAPELATKAKPVVDRIRPALEKAAPQLPIPDDTVTLVRINAGAQLVAAIALAARSRSPAVEHRARRLAGAHDRGRATRSGTRPTRQRRANQKIHFFKNLSMLGGLLLAAVDTEGRPGVAWRAKHVATGARREARHLAKQTKLEAKLAAKSLGRP